MLGPRFLDGRSSNAPPVVVPAPKVPPVVPPKVRKKPLTPAELRARAQAKRDYFNAVKERALENAARRAINLPPLPAVPRPEGI